MSFISDLRAYSKGELTEEELRISSGILDETNINIPLNAEHIRILKANRKSNSMPRLYMRSITGTTRAGADKPVHGCSVKIYGTEDVYDVTIPIVSGKEFGKLNVFMNSSEDRSFKKIVRSILYDNQEIFIAYWFNADSSDDIKTSLETILKQNIVQNNYVKHSVIRPKTEDELNEAQKELQETIRAMLQDDSIVLIYDGRQKE